jgi:sugar/nucleoside kinase (ribokinase family)
MTMLPQCSNASMSACLFKKDLILKKNNSSLCPLSLPSAKRSTTSSLNTANPGQPGPGGSMLNTAVSLGRCGLEVEMITELGQDKIGQTVLEFLAENGVSTSFIQPADGFKTPIALAFLDEKGNAAYSFYIKYPENRLNLPWPEAKKVMSCSLELFIPSIRL